MDRMPPRRARLPARAIQVEPPVPRRLTFDGRVRSSFEDKLLALSGGSDCFILNIPFIPSPKFTRTF